MKYFLFPFFVFILSSCGAAESEIAYTQPFMATIEKSAPEITETQEFSDCVEPTVRMCIAQVANEIARKENSISVCEKLQNEEEVNSCKYGVIIAEISNENIMSRCDVLNKKYKIECRIASINLLATTEDDPTKCDQIAEELFDTNEDEIGKNRVDQCKFTVIMKREDLNSKDCEEIEEGPERQTCISMVKSRQSELNKK